MRVTRLKATKKSGRVSIFIDKEFAFSVERKIVTDFKIFSGRKLTEDEIEEIEAADFKARYFKKVVKLISRRPRSKKEIRLYLRRKLKSKKDNLIDNLISELRDKGYIDDEKFANWWVENRLNFKTRGKLLLKSELKSKGIRDDIIEKIFTNKDFSDKEEVDRAIELAKKKKRKIGNIKDRKSRKKLFDYLLRKGFEYRKVKEAVQKVSNDKKYKSNLF